MDKYGLKDNVKTRIGLFGGTFDPIHQGHVQIALEAKRQFDLSEIWFIPAFNPPHKTESQVIASFQDRYFLIQLVLADHPYFRLLDIEYQRKGISYTIDTLLELKRKHPETLFYLILGDDAWDHFKSWRQPKRILEEAEILIAPRSGLYFPIEQDDKVYKIDMPLVKISSSEIRQNYRAKKPIDSGWMHPAVDSYIREKTIY